MRLESTANKIFLGLSGNWPGWRQRRSVWRIRVVETLVFCVRRIRVLVPPSPITSHVASIRIQNMENLGPSLAQSSIVKLYFKGLYKLNC